MEQTYRLSSLGCFQMGLFCRFKFHVLLCSFSPQVYQATRRNPKMAWQGHVVPVGSQDQWAYLAWLGMQVCLDSVRHGTAAFTHQSCAKSRAWWRDRSASRPNSRHDACAGYQGCSATSGVLGSERDSGFGWKHAYTSDSCPNDSFYWLGLEERGAEYSSVGHSSVKRLWWEMLDSVQRISHGKGHSI